MSERRPRLLVFNEYYWPGVEATAHLLTQLCESLAADLDVTVVTGALANAAPGRTVRNGVTVIRVAGTTFDRSKLVYRALNYATYLARSLLAGLRIAKPDIVMCWTDPPMIGDIGVVVARRAKAPLVVVTQDVFPEIAIELGRLENPALVNLLRVLVRIYLRRADSVVAIGETMAERLVHKGVSRDRLHVIPNWVDADVLKPAPRDNEWSREHGLLDKFVVMHSGNVGHAQNLDVLVRASTMLRDLADLRIFIIGSGARHGEVLRLAQRLEADHVEFLEYQPRETLALSLSSADVHFVGLASGLAGFVVPSRLYGIAAVGRPVLAAAEATSETARMVGEIGCGVVIEPNRVDEVARALRDMYNAREPLTDMGARARLFVEHEATRAVAVGRYRDLLFGLLGGS